MIVVTSNTIVIRLYFFLTLEKINKTIEESKTVMPKNEYVKNGKSFSQVDLTATNKQKEVMKILQGVPVEELTKHKKRLKIKPLLKPQPVLRNSHGG